MATAHRVVNPICLTVRIARAGRLRVAIGENQGHRRHASTSTSRIPGYSRPSRVLPRTEPRHVTSSHAHRRTIPSNQEEQRTNQSAADPTSRQLPAQPAPETSSSNAVIESSSQDHAHNVVTPSTIEDILGQDTLVVTREIEMMNVFLGFEQASKFAIKTASGNSVGYLAESEKGVLGGSIQRQVFRNHRPFEANILDTSGNVMMTIRRPFTFINSKISIYTPDPSTKEEQLVGEVHQIFHVYRRKYQLFVNRGGEKGNEEMEQFADIDEGLWAWDFMLKGDDQRPLGAISRNFRGFGREIFTDTGQYVVTFDPTTLKSSPQIEDVKDKEGKKDTSLSNTAVGRELTTSGPARPLTLQERAITLATAISADFDYFSRHSQNHAGGFMPYFWMGGGSGERGEPVPQGEGTGVGEGEGAGVPGMESGVPGSSTGGTAPGDDVFDNGPSENIPGPMADQSPGAFGQTPNDFGQGEEDVWGKQDPWGESSPTDEPQPGWGWGNNDSVGGGGGDGGGGGWLDGWFDG